MSPVFLGARLGFDPGDSDGGAIFHEQAARAGKEAEGEHQTGSQDAARTSPYQTIVDSLGEGFVTTTLDGRVRHCNPVGLKMFGCRLAQIAGRELSECIFDEFRAPARNSAKLLARIATKKGAVIRGLKGRRRGGEIFPIEVTGTRMTLGEGPLFVIIVRDVSRYTEDLVSLRRAAVVFEATDRGHHDPQSRLAGRGGQPGLFGDHRPFRDRGRRAVRRHFSTARGAAPDLAAVIAGIGSHGGPLGRRPPRPAQERRVLFRRLTVSAVRDEHAEIVGYVVILADVTQRRQDEERVRHQANYDSLTGCRTAACSWTA